jgi:hypothetical protein
MCTLKAALTCGIATAMSDELTKGDIFYKSPETRILIEKSRRHDAVRSLLPGFAGFLRT